MSLPGGARSKESSCNSKGKTPPKRIISNCIQFKIMCTILKMMSKEPGNLEVKLRNLIYQYTQKYCI